MGFSEVAIFAVPGVVLAAALWHTYKSRKAVVAARWGLALILLGLSMSLFTAFLAGDRFDANQALFVTNYLIIIAGIGAGLLGSAATAGLKR